MGGADDGLGGAAGGDVSGSPGSGAGGQATAGTGAVGEGGAAGEPSGSGGEGGVGTCSTEEFCDGVDNDCDGVVDGEGVCPFGCSGVANAGHGYMFCEVQLSWFGARAACQLESPTFDLVIVDSAEENDWLLAESDVVMGPLWIGATDAADENEWLWVDGTKFYDDDTEAVEPGMYENWLDPQPNDNDVGGEDCALFLPLENGWNDLTCSGIEDQHLHGFVCEVGE